MRAAWVALGLALAWTTAVPEARADQPRVAAAKKKKKKKATPKAPPPALVEPDLADPPPPDDDDDDDAPPPSVEVEAPVSPRPRPARPRRFYVRAGLAQLSPLAVSRELRLADVDGAASLALRDGPVAGSGAAVNGATLPAVMLGYRLTPKLAVEAVLAPPFTVRFRATGTLADESLAPMALGLPTGVPPLGTELGHATAAPPVITAVYQPRPDARVRPYYGGGLSLLLAYGAEVTNPVLTEVSQPEMSIAPAPGLVAQGGVEATVWRSVYARLDVKFIALMLARAEVRHVQVRTPALPVLDTVEVGTAKLDVWINPLIISFGVGTDF
ncbi:MAG: OmpW family outer membrane protein [Kofleriaceae bacterium]